MTLCFISVRYKSVDTDHQNDYLNEKFGQMKDRLQFAVLLNKQLKSV